MGCLIVDVAGKELSAEDQEILAHPLVGGVVLFTRNYAEPEQLKNLCSTIRNTRKTPLLIMVDQEGGRVQRFIPQFTRLPCMATFGKMYDDNSEGACELAKDCGWLMAAEILAMGIDLSLAPVLDLNKGMSTVIGDRSFHSGPKAVTQLAKAFIMGMQEAGMAATGKHFPGHGSVTLDSHTALPVDMRSFAEIEHEDLFPFIELIKSGIAAVMAAHIIFPAVDQLPVGFSRRWLSDILLTRLKFKGVILSDDLGMEGANISANYADRVSVAREAGCDFALLCNNRRGVMQTLDQLEYSAHQVSKEKWSLLQAQFSRTKLPLKENKKWQKTHELLLRQMHTA